MSLLLPSTNLSHCARLRSTNLSHCARLRSALTLEVFESRLCRGKELDGPVGMALDADSLLVASFTNDVILRINLTNGELINKIGSEDTLDCPEGIAFSPDGRLFVASFLLPHLSVFDPESGAFLGRFGSSLQPALPTAAPPLFGLGKHEGPRGAEDLAFDLDGNVHVTGYYSNAVFKFNGTSGALELTYGRGLVHGPVGVVCDDLS